LKWQSICELQGYDWWKVTTDSLLGESLLHKL
jgi:hypothetical protein